MFESTTAVREARVADHALLLDPSLRAPLAMVVAGLDALSAEAVADLPGEQALLEASVLLVQLDRLRALALARVADVDRRQLHSLDDLPSTAAWVAQQATSMTRGEVALARKLERMPSVAARIAAGGLSLDSGIQIGRALTRLRPHVDRPDGMIDGQPAAEVLPAVVIDGVCQQIGEACGGLADDDPVLQRVYTEVCAIAAAVASEEARLEAAFLVVARHVDGTLLRSVLSLLVDALLPNEMAKQDDGIERDRAFHLLKHDDGSSTPRGLLDAELTALVETVITASMATDPDNPADTAADAELRAQGLDPYEDGCVRRRSWAQRRHDALKLALRALLSTNGLGTRGKDWVHVSVTISEAALHAAPGALPARTATGGRLPLHVVRRMICDSPLTRFVVGLGNRVVESSHTERTLKPHERRIKHLETGGVCQAAGCTRGTATGHPLIPHHPDPYAVSGATSLDDSVLLCEASHGDLHEGGRNVRLKDGRVLTPTGWAEPLAA